MKNNPIKKELLFVHHTSLDNNPMVIALIDNTTNYIHTQDLLDTKILLAIGLSQDDINMCKLFFDPEFK